MSLFHFIGRIDNHTAAASVEMDSVLHAALEAGHQIRQQLAAKGITGYLAVERVAAPVVTDEHAATREMGRKMGLTEAQIDRFIARQV